MPSSKNITSLEEIKEKLEKAQAVFLVDYTGLTHQQLEELRRELDAVKAEAAILKNTLVNIAFHLLNQCFFSIHGNSRFIIINRQFTFIACSQW